MTRSRLVIFILRSALLLSIPCVGAYAQTDALQLDSTVLSVSGRRPLLEAGAGQVTRVDVAQLAVLPSILGNSDPLHFVQMLPSMQTSSEADAGIHIQGCDHQHNFIALNGVPVYGATHLMGLFSVFNPTHFNSMAYSTVASGVNRLGGVIDMHTQKSLQTRCEGEASLGLVSAQGTVKVPLSNKSSLLVSGRESLVDLLYGNYMKLDDIPLSYGFSDANLTWIWKPSASDLLTADFYYGDDRAFSDAQSMGAGADLYWRNMLAALHWTHSDLAQYVYYTAFRLDADLSEEGSAASVPSHIGTFGYKGEWNSGPLGLKLDAAWHDILPQNPQISGSGIEYESESVLNAVESSLSACWRGTIGYKFDYSATLIAQCFVPIGEKPFFGLSPQLSGTYFRDEDNKFHFRAGIYRQYLFQTGISNVGLPLEFWLPAGKYSKPQWSLGTSVSWDKSIRDGDFSLSSELYFRFLGHQLEYMTGLQTLLDGSYSLERSLQKGSGHAYGLNVMMHKLKGRLTGWAGLSVGRSMRAFDGGVWPSNHERLVEMDVVATYKLGNWDFGATMVAAGGTPFTPAQEYYILSNQLVAVYREYNSGRLRPYFRLDLNARLNFKDVGRVHHGLNLSVYNATAHRQEVYRTLKLGRDDGIFRYGPVFLGITVLPSVAYFVKF